jgi:hypothetical protein
LIEHGATAIISMTDRRLTTLRAALGFLQITPRAP